MKLAPVLTPSDWGRPTNRSPARGRDPLRNTVAPVARPSGPRTTTALRPSCTAAVRAIAVAHEDANCVGTVELSCAAEGLHLNFVRISAYSEGYIPFPATCSHRITVAYDRIAQVCCDPEGLVRLCIDPSCTAYNRLVLAGLAHEPQWDQVLGLRKRQKLEHSLTLGAVLAWVPVAWLLHLAMPWLSPPVAMGIAATVSALLHVARRDIATRLVLFNRKADRVRSELLTDLALRLGPERVHDRLPVDAVAAQAPEPEPALRHAEAAGLSTLFATAAVVAAIALVAILIGRNLVMEPGLEQADGTRQQHSQVQPTHENVAAPGGVPIQPAARAPSVLLAPCSCDRADSALWSDGIPRMSVLARNLAPVNLGKKPTVRPEIAVVNNANEDLKEVMLTVDFMMGEREGKPGRNTGQQGLYYDGTLHPGQAIKWRTKGKGDDFTVTSFVTGKLGDSNIDPAPADAFAKLLMAHTPVVRLHGAKMLAWLGDPRARDAIDRLARESSEEMTPTLNLLSDAVRSVRVCSVHARPAASDPSAFEVQACVFNASDQPCDRPMVTAKSGQGQSVRETRWTVEAKLSAFTGVVTTGLVASGGESATELESLLLSAER
jgi:hypothetical protein